MYKLFEIIVSNAFKHGIPIRLVGSMVYGHRVDEPEIESLQKTYEPGKGKHRDVGIV